ncbi:MAG: hypothetical protein RJB38_1359 [Pseudomonadota bacterium]|jgi:hypothetical protein
MIHSLVGIVYSREAAAFSRSLKDPELAQRRVLEVILRSCSRAPWGERERLGEIRSYEQFAERIPASEYSRWYPLIEQQRRSGRPILNTKVTRYEPTSGSTGERKWIPYTPEFLGEMNRAARAWIHDVQNRHEGARRGRHFWSLSWIPSELRGAVNTDDRELFPAWQRLILNRLVVSHPALQHAPSSESAWWATLLLLASASDLSLISVWSPTYLTTALREIFQHREELAEALREGRWLRHERELGRFVAPSRRTFPVAARDFPSFIQRLWPRLALVSAWDSAMSVPYADELRRLLPQVTFQGKGLWATEGVVTIPWKDRYPVAIRSHFVEFRCLASGRILPVWRVEPGQELQPLLTTGSGLLRYELPDRVRVSGMIERTPTLEFLGRIGGVDLTGEKLSFEKASGILAGLQQRFGKLKLFCLGVRPRQTPPRYTILGVGEEASSNALAQALEDELLRIHHYAVARELKQLAPAEARILPSAAELESVLGSAEIRGQSKPNSIVFLSG